MTQITLRTAVVVPFILIFMITMGSIITVQKFSYEEMVEVVSDKHLTSLTTNVVQKLNYYLEEPFQAALSISHSIGQNNLYQKDNLEVIEKYILSSFESLYQPMSQLGVISFGSEAKEYLGFRKEANNDYSLMLQDNRTDGKLVIYQGNAITPQARAIIDNYDPTVRPWYTPVATHGKATWSSIYTDADERQTITISALAPVIQDEQFVGVIANDIKIHTFNAFLKELKQRTKATIYIFDNEQQLVTHSSDKSVVSWGTPITDKGERLLAIESNNPIIYAMAQFIRPLAFPVQSRLYKFDLVLEGERYFSLVTPYTDHHGLEWYIGVSISEPDLLGALPNNQRLSWSIGIFVSAIGIALGLLAFNRITQPITETAQSARALAYGDWETNMPKPGRIYEISVLVNAFNDMTNNLKASFQTLRNQLLYDSLTNLYSREGLIDCCDKLPALNGSLLLIGINQFRNINDSIGHNRADLLLKDITHRVKQLFNNDAYIARIGGDEFAVYLTEGHDNNELKLLANRVHQVFASPFVMEKNSLVINAAIGVVPNNSELLSMEKWLRNGSIALSNAKHELSNISFYLPEMADISKNRTAMMAKLQTAIENNEFVAFYQPIIDLNTGDVIGAEALARWISPQEGLISPLDFIPIAEEYGFIAEIGEQILRQACRDTMLGTQQGKWGETFHMHVNISAHQLSHQDFINTLTDIISESGIQTHNLTLEITESRIVSGDKIVLDNMQAIQDLGCHIAIDDFGTGYSSLAYLHELPFDCIKIDRTFVEQMKANNLDSSIVSAIINMTKGMKVDIVAEGIETIEQVQMLNSLHCPQGQGFLYSRPVPFEEWPTHLVNIEQ
ncbi:EAL domain-containing protein [Vibrio sp. ZSDE26]|uniref:EAL domain-containing protein n=1 Tax=Vibrio amylolyticus TaxID=2847292 RepID=A0A9X1XHN7_9VIBR|nr:GGDEF and EAL domain-containing protein [Vibrio amylolyticus]MCK6263337.1 EAL domain-containing protein [Vibrio amylolyticus]